MDDPSRKAPRKTALVLLCFVVVMGILAAGSWLYQHFRLLETTQSPAPPEKVRASAKIVLDTQQRAPSSTTQESLPLPASPLPAKPRFQVSIDPMQEFKEDLKNSLLRELTPAFPELSTYLEIDPEKGADATYRSFSFRFLDAAERAQGDRQPAMLLAADLLVNQIWCLDDNKAGCDQVRSQFVQHNLTFEHEQLGGGYFYSRDVLWRVWLDYPASEAGQGAFVLLLDLGWDTSGTCNKGSDQFREVIRQGELFLQSRPTSPYRPVVSLLVGQAYATWFALSNEPSAEMSDYVDPKLYQAGAGEAREKAIRYLEAVSQMAPNTKLAEYASQAIPPLRLGQVPEQYKFFCVYD